MIYFDAIAQILRSGIGVTFLQRLAMFTSQFTSQFDHVGLFCLSLVLLSYH